MNHQTLPPAGWHPDPTSEDQLRYWNGQSWTEHVHPFQSPTVTPRVQTNLANQAPGLLRTVFDFKLRSDRVATVKIARFVYVAVGLISVLLWVGIVSVAFLLGASSGMPEFAVIGILSLPIGAVLVVVLIAAVRVVLEFVLANIRTAQHTALIVEHARQASQPLSNNSPGAAIPDEDRNTADWSTA